MTQKAYTPKEFITYSRNAWTRNLIARLVEVEVDIAMAKKNPEEMVIFQMPMTRELFEMPVKQRLEKNKLLVQEALDYMAAGATLAALDDAGFAQKISPEALAPAPEKKVEETKPAASEAADQLKEKTPEAEQAKA